jgi:hypothetical protein
VTGLGTVAASGGIATLDVTGDEAGSVTLVATSGSLTSNSLSFEVTPENGAIASGDNQTGTVGQELDNRGAI